MNVTGKSTYSFITQLMNSAVKKGSLANRGGHVSGNVHFERRSVGDVVIAKYVSSQQLLIPSKSTWKQEVKLEAIVQSFN